MHIKITSKTKITRVYEHMDPSSGEHIVDIMGDGLLIEEVETLYPDNSLPESPAKLLPGVPDHTLPGQPEVPVKPEQLPITHRHRLVRPDHSLPVAPVKPVAPVPVPVPPTPKK